MIRPEDRRGVPAGCTLHVHDDPGRRRGLGPLLAHVDERLMDDVADEEPVCPVHPREVGIAGERRRHPHRRKRRGEAVRRLERELREDDPDPPIGQRVPEVRERLRIQYLFRRRQVVFLREEDEHREFRSVSVRIRHPEHLEAVGLRVPVDRILVRAVHHRNPDRLARSDPELLLGRLGGVELLDPGPLEVDRVRDHEPGHGVDRTGGEEVADLILGLLLHPAVDGLARRFGVAGEVEVRDVRPIPPLRRIDICREERVGSLRPEGVCGAESVVLVPVVQNGIEPGKPGSPKGLVLWEVKHRPDLVAGRAPGALVGDREGRGDAVGREEDVFTRRSRVACNLPVEVEREPVVPRRDVADASGIRSRRLLPGGRGRLPGRRLRYIGASRGDAADRDEACEEQQADDPPVHEMRYGAPDSYTWR